MFEGLFDTPAVYRRKDKSTTIRGPLDLLNAVLDAGKKGLSIQRYKGYFLGGLLVLLALFLYSAALTRITYRRTAALARARERQIKAEL